MALRLFIACDQAFLFRSSVLPAGAAGLYRQELPVLPDLTFRPETPKMAERYGITRFRRELVDLLARSVPFTDLPDDETGVPTAVLVVLEWQGDDGNRWLAISSCLGSGQPAPPWTERMLAWEALHWND